MCGIAGVFETSVRSTKDELASHCSQMTNALLHRGPDEGRLWIDSTRGIALGFRRLAIMDLSSAGMQPMHSPCQRYVLVFNGEIYNFRELRKELIGRGYSFFGHSDSEVLASCLSEFGFESTLPKIYGMFAIAVWDKKEQHLLLARDRLGKKPLYYGNFGSHFLFGSELRALRQHPEFEENIDRSALAQYFRFGWIPWPKSIYQNVRKLPAASYLVVNAERNNKPQFYWEPHKIAQVEKRQNRHPQEALQELETLLDTVVSQRLESDVPLGALLSGGIDSSLVVAIAHKKLHQPLRTFSIGFNDKEFNEAPFAKKIAQSLGTEHSEYFLSYKEAIDRIPLMPSIYDEPFSDSSQIPTSLVFEIAKKSVTVALTGDGGDEFFVGYNRYLWGKKFYPWMHRLSPSLRSHLARIVKAGNRQAVLKPLSRLLPKKHQVAQIQDKVFKLVSLLGLEKAEDVYWDLLASSKERLVLGEPLHTAFERVQPQLTNPLEQMLFLDMVGELSDDMMTKVDRASMNVSLECRSPLMDHRIAEFAWSCPLDLKLNEGKGKWLLRTLLSRHVPTELFERPKMGFSIPLGRWLRNELRDWVESLLNSPKLDDAGLDRKTIQRLWKEHLSGKFNHQDCLWSATMFSAWLNHASPKVTNIPLPLIDRSREVNPSLTCL